MCMVTHIAVVMAVMSSLMCNVTVVKLVAVVTLLAVVTGNGGNRQNIGFSVHGYTE